MSVNTNVQENWRLVQSEPVELGKKQLQFGNIGKKNGEKILKYLLII